MLALTQQLQGDYLMCARRVTQPIGTPADLPPEKAYSHLKKQLEELQPLKTLQYHNGGDNAEDEWMQYTETIVRRGFGTDSQNYKNFRDARSAGEYYISYGGVDHALNQQNFQTRLAAYETALRSCLRALELDLPEPEIKGAYQPGEEYEFYRDLRTCLESAVVDILVVDPYLDTDIFNTYADAIDRTVIFRLLSANVPGVVQAVAHKYAAGKNFALRTSNSIHDRVIFADKRVWVAGQSIKDAAKKKPTYIIEHDEAIMRPIYEAIWNSAAVLI
jgi:hypothetical protein